jgi:hypothetical protein
MRERRISREDVYRTIEKPDDIGLPTRRGRQHVQWRKTEQIAIDVVYELLESAVLVITTYKVDLFAEKGKPPTLVRLRKQPPKSKGKRRKPKQR